jgi:hypothetical protein
MSGSQASGGTAKGLLRPDDRLDMTHSFRPDAGQDGGPTIHSPAAANPLHPWI